MFSATNDVQAKDCRHLDCRHTSRRSRVSAAVKAAMLLQRDCALAAMVSKLRYENSTTMRQRGAGKTVRGYAFFERSIGATSVQVYNHCTTATRPLRGRATSAQPGDRRTPARIPVPCGATAAHPYDLGAASTGALRDDTSLTQLCNGDKISAH